MRAYYNDNDPFAADWLRNLIAEGLITPGDVDERSIKDVEPDDVAGYERVHFFAGVAGWDAALTLAGWRGPVWTGSCPCQPFSAAGKQRGTADERHLWPELFRLVKECNPATIFGEQVASKFALEWLDGVFADLEGEDYACAAADLCAASVGAPHIRQRLWWMADANQDGQRSRSGRRRRMDATERREPSIDLESSGSNGRVADANGGQSSDGHLQRSGQQRQQPQDGGASGLGDTSSTRPQERIGDEGISRSSISAKPWEASELASCRDGKARRVKPGVRVLAHGIPNRVGKLRGYGNAIVPQIAAKFVEACMAAASEA